MRVLSNAFLSQAEIESLDHWEQGPLELIFLDVDQIELSECEWTGLVANWNREYQGGWLRDGHTCDKLEELIPALKHTKTPNIFIVPRQDGVSELDVMLASLLPEETRQRHDIAIETPANMWLLPFGREGLGPDFASRCERAFEEYIWSKLMPSTRHHVDCFSRNSPYRLLAGDTRLWMNRIYHVALERWESFPIVSEDSESWEPLEVIQQQVYEELPELRGRVEIRRPRTGGEIWNPEDQEECDEVISEAIAGARAVESLENVVDLLLSNATHEDFADRYSWVKEDFERSFYSKRARVKVTLVETVDDFPVWTSNEPQGYENILYRDMLALLDIKERHLVVALRHGKTLTEIAEDLGYKSHSPISRAVSALKEKVRRILD